MSQHQHALQSIDSQAFAGGRYFHAFNFLPNIDRSEHSILTYLGSLLPPVGNHLEQPVFPSVAAIARATHMDATTVRRKIRSLEEKNYLSVHTVHYINVNGRKQQGANQYLFTSQAFELYAEHLRQQTQVEIKPRKPALAVVSVPDATPFPPAVEKDEAIPIPPMVEAPAAAEIAAPAIDSTPAQEFEPAHQPASPLPKNREELLHAIDAYLAGPISDKVRGRMAIIRDTASRSKFEVGLSLFKKYLTGDNPLSG